MRTIALIAFYVALVWFITRFIAFCSKEDENHD